MVHFVLYQYSRFKQLKPTPLEINFTIPGTDLKDIVHSFWQNSGNTTHFEETIIPKGIIEIIFDFSEQGQIPVKIGGKQYTLPKIFINGFNTLPIHLQLPPKQCFFGVRFFATATYDITGVHAGEFANQSVDMALIDRAFGSLWHQLIEQKTFTARVAIFSKWVRERRKVVSERNRAFDSFLTTVNNEMPTVSELSKALCYSTRQLSRKFITLTGMNTEGVLLYKKYLRSLDLICHTGLSLTEIAYDCQFSDQSHFIKTFRAFSLITPGDYRKIKGPVPGHFYQGAR